MSDAVPQWIEDPDEDDDEPDLESLGSGPAETVAETLRLQCDAMITEGFSPLAVVTGLAQIAAEYQWELYERITEK